MPGSTSRIEASTPRRIDARIEAPYRKAQFEANLKRLPEEVQAAIRTPVDQRTAVSLTVWVAAFWLAIAFGEPLSAQLTAVESPAARLFLGYAAIFLGTLIGGGVLIWLIDKFLSRTGLSSTDRLLGLCFGLLRGYAIGCVMVLGLGFTPLPRERWWQMAAAGDQWLTHVERSASAYGNLTDYLAKKMEWTGAATGLDRTELRKHVRSTARSVLPNATETMLWTTWNARSLRNFLELPA